MAKKAFEDADSSGSLPAGHPPIQAMPADTKAAAVPGSVAGIHWSIPADWSELAPRPMRAATYALSEAASEFPATECAVYYFGAGQGGGVQANVDRWVGQFKQPDGGTSADLATTMERTVNGVHVTTVDVSGTYVAGMGPRSVDNKEHHGYRMLAAIVEGPQGPVFFKLTGPVQVVADQLDNFEDLVKSIQVAS